MDYERLESRRKQLNAYVRALHQPARHGQHQRFGVQPRRRQPDGSRRCDTVWTCQHKPQPREHPEPHLHLVRADANSAFGEDFGLEREEVRATIGRGSRQTVHVLQDDGELEEVEVVTGQSDGRFTVVTSDELRPGMKVVTSIRAAGE